MQVTLLRSIEYIVVAAMMCFCSLHCVELTDQSEKGDWKTRLEYARLLSYMKKFNESAAEYKKLLAEKPDSTQVKIELAKIYYYQHEYAQALAVVNEIPNEAITSEMQVILADILVAQKDYPKAEEIYRRSLESASKEGQDAILLKLADVQSWQKKYNESLANFRTLLERHPEDVPLKRKYALVLFWAGENEEAAKQLESTLKVQR